MSQATCQWTALADVARPEQSQPRPNFIFAHSSRVARLLSPDDAAARPVMPRRGESVDAALHRLTEVEAWLAAHPA